ncbi:subtilisin-like protein [Zopfia rhizophila CBS 207.26]|uniref:Subtilisin-like protein n=1 Tax=Zopfia rhizophila CBS 207.26 TaxID=1314779 RepID=A0A6A6DBY6_9PEZI|nr:subtilisin-like protein [Zopfia rhizophila CBS 207.26]
MHFTILLLLYPFTAYAFTTRHETHSVHEKRTENTRLWKRLPSPVDLEIAVPLSIALSQRNLESAGNDLLSISEPSSPLYGHHWSPAKVMARFSPTHQSISAVIRWLEESGIDRKRIKLSNSRDWLLLNTTIREAQQLLKTEYYQYIRQNRDEIYLGCEEYRLPDSIRRHIVFVLPTVHIGVGAKLDYRHTARAPTRRASRYAPSIQTLARRQVTRGNDVSLNLSNCHNLITPNCLRAMYHLPISKGSHPANSFGIFQPTFASWLPFDLDSFFSLFAPSLIGRRPTMVSVNEGSWQDSIQHTVFNLEANLDFEYAMALSAPLPLINYQVAGMFSPLLAAFDPFHCDRRNISLSGGFTDAYAINDTRPYNNDSSCRTLRPPAVLSISYAENEAELPPSYRLRQCIDFLKLGLMGTTVIVSSGDCGPSGQACECVDLTSGRLNGKTNSGAFGLTFPASCPYVTAVGGTQLPPNGSVTDREVAFYYTGTDQIGTSGGGFSNLFPVPAYQAEATAAYLAAEGPGLSNISFFSPKGRGVPDVAAHAANYVVAVNGNLTTAFGTSGSAPVFASIIAMVNDARLRAGKSTVGFLNPLLYSNKDVMNDVVQGVSYGCGREAFRAREGWDPVTGLGTPDYRKLVDLYLSIP